MFFFLFNFVELNSVFVLYLFLFLIFNVYLCLKYCCCICVRFIYILLFMKGAKKKLKNLMDFFYCNLVKCTSNGLFPFFGANVSIFSWNTKYSSKIQTRTKSNNTMRKRMHIYTFGLQLHLCVVYNIDFENHKFETFFLCSALDQLERMQYSC